MANANFLLSTLNGSINGFTFNGVPESDLLGGSVSGAGDINGDGIDDFIIAATGANDGFGRSYVVFGRKEGFPTQFNLTSLDGNNGFSLNSVRSVSGAGDINSDGIDDLIIAATGANDGFGRSYVVFGRQEGFPARFNLASLNGSNGFVLNGINRSAYSNIFVSEAGDLNGDGIDDLIIGGYKASYVIFGRQEGFPAQFNLASLNGRNGFALYSTQYSLSFASLLVSEAGDINGDGFDDLIIANDFSTQGYVVFGRQEGFPAQFNLASLNGSNGFALRTITFSKYGSEYSEVIKSVSGVGDINGDGFDDLIIGVPRTDSVVLDFSARSYVIFGRTEGFPAQLNLASLNGSNGFTISGTRFNELGETVSEAGDINGDGIDDLIVEEYYGQSYVIFGRTEGFPARFNSSYLNGSNGFILDSRIFSISAASPVSEAGDINGDGIDDLIIGRVTFDNPRDFGSYESGRGYIVYGNTPPVLDLDDSSPNINLATNFTGDVVPIVSDSLRLSDNGSNIAKAVIIITNPLDGAAESLSANTSSTNIAASYRNGILTLVGIDTIANYQQVLRTITYNNTASSPNPTTRLINFFIDDGGAHSNTSSVATTTLTLSREIDGTPGNDTLNGTIGSDRINGLAGNDFILGFASNDTLNGGLGRDRMRGGLGNDTYFVNSSGDVVVENVNQGNDTVLSTLNLTLRANVENLTLLGAANLNGTGNNLNNRILGNRGNNRLNGSSGNDILNGGLGNDRMAGGFGNDTYFVNSSRDRIVEAANQGKDTVLSAVNFSLRANIENLNLLGVAIAGVGNNLNNRITGNRRGNILNGSSGNDTLNGALGSDTMRGGLGNDIYIVNSNGDVIVEAANQGNDTVWSIVDRTLTANVENLRLLSIANLNATGNRLNNRLAGNLGNNLLNGLAGNDSMAGSLGDDIYIVNSRGDVIVEAANQGNDTILSTVNRSLTANVENLTLLGTVNLNGTGNNLNNRILGNRGNNRLNGSSGNDTLNGGLGRDRMIGGGGNDTYFVNSSGDVIVEAANQGNDTVFSAVSRTLTNNLENLTLLSVANLNTTGNNRNNRLTGNPGNNLLNGLAGNDTLNGGLGRDRMIGGRGNDTYLVNGSGDVVVESSNQGNDTVFSAAVNYTLTANVENLTLSGVANLNGVGNNLNNRLVGNPGNNNLNGVAGNDRMAGGLANDTYFINSSGDVAIESVNQGTDTVLSTVNRTLETNVENLTLVGATNLNATGNNLNNRIIGNRGNNILNGLVGSDLLIGGLGRDRMVGAAGDDTLNGGLGSDRITGGLGDDTLSGGLGSDILIGGLDDDTYSIDSSRDRVVEAPNQGDDTIISAFNHSLAANLENLNLSGTANLNGVGNNSNNNLTGNRGNNLLNGLAGNDTLSGGLGSDTLIGSLGNDFYLVNSSRDVVVEAPNQGDDTVFSTIDLTLTTNLENLNLSGTANLDGVGNNRNNNLTGNGGNNRLNGSSGNDALNGGLGRDTLTGGASNDLFVLGAGGYDVITDFTDGQDRLATTPRGRFDNLVVTQGTGANANNTFIRRLSDDNELLAILVGVRASSITSADISVV